MTIVIRARNLVLCIGLCAVAGGCSARFTNHGYAPQDVELESIEVGVDTEADVARKIGRPADTGLIDTDAWYYMSTRLRTVAFYAPEVADRRLVAVQFNPEGFVRDVTVYGVEDGRPIELVTRTTETFGQELSVVEQLIGSLFNIRVPE